MTCSKSQNARLKARRKIRPRTRADPGLGHVLRADGIEGSVPVKWEVILSMRLTSGWVSDPGRSFDWPGNKCDEKSWQSSEKRAGRRGSSSTRRGTGRAETSLRMPLEEYWQLLGDKTTHVHKHLLGLHWIMLCEACASSYTRTRPVTSPETLHHLTHTTCAPTNTENRRENSSINRTMWKQTQNGYS